MAEVGTEVGSVIGVDVITIMTEISAKVDATIWTDMKRVVGLEAAAFR